MSRKIHCLNTYSNLYMQWAFGVTCWEVFTCGRVPYSGITPLSLLGALRNGERLDTPNNTACSDEMYGIIIIRV